MPALASFLLAAAATLAMTPKVTVLEPEQGLVSTAPEPGSEDHAFARDRHNRMTVPVRVGGRGPYRFLVDTGADRTAVSSGLASALQLRTGKTATLHSATGATTVQLASVPRLELSANRVREIEAPVLEARHMGADGILGLDSLRSQRVLFDFRARTISIVPSAQRLSRHEKGTIVVTGKLRNGHLIVTRAQTAGLPLTVVLDTGTEVTIGNPALRARLAARGKLRNPEATELMSVTGAKLKGEIYLLDQVEIGGVTLENLAVMFADAHTFTALNFKDRPAVLLGMNALKAFDKVSVDFERKKLRLLMRPHGGLPQVMVAARY